MSLFAVRKSNHHLQLVAAAVFSGGLLLPACSTGGSYGTSSQNTSAAVMPPPPAPVAAPPPAAAPPQPSASVLASEHLEGIGSASLVEIHGKIVAVDRPNQLVTLEGPGGKQITLQVRNPYNLAAAQPGLPVVMRFYEIVTIRKEQPGESIPTVSLTQGIATAAPGQTPGGAVGTSVEMVATIVGINRAKETADLQGPDGSVETVKVANPAVLRHVKIGTDIVMTLTKVMAITLDKEPGV